MAGESHLEGKDRDGAKLRERPETRLSVWNKYTLNVQLSRGLGMTHQAESLASTGGTAYLPYFTRVDAAIDYKLSEKLKLQLNIENLTDVLYYPNAHKDSQVTVGAPLNATFTVVGKF